VQLVEPGNSPRVPLGAVHRHLAHREGFDPSSIPRRMPASADALIPACWWPLEHPSDGSSFGPPWCLRALGLQPEGREAVGRGIWGVRSRLGL